MHEGPPAGVGGLLLGSDDQGATLIEVQHAEPAGEAQRRRRPDRQPDRCQHPVPREGQGPSSGVGLSPIVIVADGNVA